MENKKHLAYEPGQTVGFTFWQWFYDTTSWGNIQTAIQQDYVELN